MKINELPEVIQVPLFDGRDGQIWVDATVLFVSEKLVPTERGGGEDFIVMCYTDDSVIHEVHLNTTKIIKTRKVYEQARTTFDTRKKRRGTRGKKNAVGNNNPNNEGANKSKG